jgi:hypothetical protein
MKLSPTPEQRGDHQVSINLPAESVTDLYYRDAGSGGVWLAADNPASFTVTEDGEGYELQFRSRVDVAYSSIGYFGIGAAYAPTWAWHTGYLLINHDPEPCCDDYSALEAALISGPIGVTPASGLSKTGTVSVLLKAPSPYADCYGLTEGCIDWDDPDCVVVKGSSAYRIGCPYCDDEHASCDMNKVTLDETSLYNGGAPANVTILWAGADKPYDWLAKAFTATHSVSISEGVQVLQSKEGGGYETGTVNVSVKCKYTISKTSGEDHIVFTHESGSLEISSDGVYDAMVYDLAPGQENPLVQDIETELPCTDARLRTHATVSLLGSYYPPNISPTLAVTISIDKP